MRQARAAHADLGERLVEAHSSGRASTVCLVSTILSTPRALQRAQGHSVPRVVCVACGLEDSAHAARLEGWQSSRAGRSVRCAACAELQLVALADQALYWPSCGHGLDDDVVLYDRPVCVVCDDTGG
jgi:hypothetical protein